MSCTINLRFARIARSVRAACQSTGRDLALVPAMALLMNRRGCERALRTVVSVVFLTAGLICSAPTLYAQSAENVAVVVNERSPVSQKIADYYVRKRGVPASNVIRISTSIEESIERGEYVVTIEQPIGAALTRAGLQDRVLYLVLTK